LTLVVSQQYRDYPIQETYPGFNEWLYPIPESQAIINDFGNKNYVVVYDISRVTLGSPLKVAGHKKLTGDLFAGRSIGNKVIIGTESFIDISTGTLSRSQSQYCGLNSTSYKELATETAAKLVESFAKEMIALLNLEKDCSRIFQMSMMTSSIEESGFTGANLLNSFVHVFVFDMSTDFGVDGDIALSLAGAFTANSFSIMYLADDFLAISSNVYNSDYASRRLFSETFILGFDVSTNYRATPFSYGHVPGALDINYVMNKSGRYLRMTTSDESIIDAINWTSTYTHKLYILKLPSIKNGPGKMSLVGETEKLIDTNGLISNVRFIKDKAYVSTSSSEQNNQFIIVDLSDHRTPKDIGRLKVRLRYHSHSSLFGCLLSI
jgi:hypothetical protein